MTETTISKVLPRPGLAAPALSLAEVDVTRTDADLRQVAEEEARHVLKQGQATKPWSS